MASLGYKVLYRISLVYRLGSIFLISGIGISTKCHIGATVVSLQAVTNETLDVLHMMKAIPAATHLNYKLSM